MADKEINIKVTANTDDAKKGIAEVTNELEKMSTSGSGKAADELDKVTEAADKAGAATDKLGSSWEEYKQNVREAEAEVRKLNATQFENAEQRDATINELGDKLDDLVYEGKIIEESMKALGLPPESLDGFNSVVNILRQANEQFTIALDHRDKLLNQPTAPDSPLVQTNPWEDGPDGNSADEFKRRYQDLRAELEGFRTEMEGTISALDNQKAALQAEYSALDASSEGYLERKKLLEQLMSTAETLTVSFEGQRQQIVKQTEALDELNKETTKSEDWAEGGKSLEDYGNKAIITGQKVEKSRQQMLGITSRYENAVISAQQKEISGQAKIQAQMEMAGKTREELIRLVEEYGKALANAKTKEEYESAKAGITAARKQLTMLSREATLTGAAIGNSATTVQGFATSLARAGIQGRLTFKGLTAAVRTFAKSTLVLAGIQFAWEALSKIYEKVKVDLFGVADAEEEASAKAEALAEAAKKASDELLQAQRALGAWRADQARSDAANDFTQIIKEQNEYYKEQVRLVDEATAALLRQVAVNAKEGEHEIAIERLRLQEQKMKGLIDEYEYQEKLVDLESRAAEIRRESNIDAKALVKQGKAEQLAEAKAALGEAEMTATEDMSGFELSSEEVQVQIAAYKDLKAEVEKYRDEYVKLKKTEAETRKYLAGYGESGPKNWLDKERFNEAKRALEIIERYEANEANMSQVYADIPELVRDFGLDGTGLSQYNKTRSSKLEYNRRVEEQIQKYSDEVARLEKDFIKAELEWENAAVDAALAATQQEELTEQKLVNIRVQRDNEKAREDAEKRIDKAKREVQNMEFAALKKEAAQMTAWADMVDGRTPEGQNRQAIAAVYTQAYERLRAEGKEASGLVAEAGAGASGKAADVVAKAKKLAFRAGTGREINLAELSALLDKALSSRKDASDDAAVMALYNVVAKHASAAEKNSREMKVIRQKVKNLEKINAD